VDGRDEYRCFFLDGDGVDVTFLGLTISNGYASSSSDGGAYGGGVYSTSTGVALTFSRCTISSCTATYGSGIYVGSYGTLAMDYSSFYYNQGATSGGGLYFSGSSATLSYVEFSMNSAASGAGAYIYSGDFSMSSYSFESNAATDGFDLFLGSRSSFTPENGCERGTYNYGSGLLICSGCAIAYLPAILVIDYIFPSPAPTATKMPSVPDPSSLPSSSPTNLPRPEPSSLPSSLPSERPSPAPTALPTLTPTLSPSVSRRPSNIPTVVQVPTIEPSVSLLPVRMPTGSAQPSLTLAPSQFASDSALSTTSSPPLRRRLLDWTLPDSYLNWCAEITSNVEVQSQSALAASVMPNRTVNLGSNIYLSSTLYFLIGVNEGLDGFVIDGGGRYAISGQNAVRCMFIVGSGLKMALKSLTVTNGYASSESTHGNYGGAIYVGDGAVLELDGCTVSSSATASYGHGGAIYVDAATLKLTDTTIKSNYVYYGKGAGLYLTSKSELSMVGGSITSNAQYSGYVKYTWYSYNNDGSIRNTCTSSFLVLFCLPCNFYSNCLPYLICLLFTQGPVPHRTLRLQPMVEVCSWRGRQLPHSLAPQSLTMLQHTEQASTLVEV